MKKILFLLFVFLGLLVAKPIVTTSILPTKYFIEQIAGNTILVNTMVEKSGDPHTYEPKPRQMKNLEKSDLYFAVGIGFENTWLKKFKDNYPNLKIIYTQDGIQKISMQDDDNHEHDDHGHHHHKQHHVHGPHCNCSHDGLDPHIWLDPMLVKVQVKNIAHALTEKFPENKELYEKNLNSFNKRLDELDFYIKQRLKGVKNKAFIVYHPSWGYFAKRYNLHQMSIEVEGKEPKPGQLVDIISEANEHNVKVIFVAPQFSKKSADLIAKQTKAKVVSIDHLAYDWEKGIKKSADIFAQSMNH